MGWRDTVTEYKPQKGSSWKDTIQDEEAAPPVDPEAGPVTEKHGPLWTGAANFADTVSLGYSPQIKAGMMEAADGLGLPSDHEKYADRRDYYRKELTDASNDNPISATVGSLGGIGGMIAANPAGAVSKFAGPLAESALGKAAIESLVNLGIMGLQNPGDEKGIVDPVQGQRRMDMLKAPLSDTIPVLDQIPTGALAAVPMAGPTLLRGANKLTAKAFGPKPTEIAKSMSRGGLLSEDSLGRYAQSTGLSKAMSSAGDLYDRTAARVSQVGQKIGNFVTENGGKIESWLANNVGPESQAALENSFHVDNSRARALSQVSRTDPDYPAIAKHVNDYFDNLKGAFGSDTNPEFTKLQQIRSEVQNKIKYDRKNPMKTPGTEKAYAAILSEVDRSMEHELNLIEKMPGIETKKLQALRKEYSLGKTLEGRALRQASRGESSQMSINLPAAGIGALSGHAMSENPNVAGILATIGGLTGSQIKGGPRMYSTLGALGAGQASRITSSPALMSTMSAPEPEIEGFPVRTLQPLEIQYKEAERGRIKGSNMPPSLKARQLNALEKGYIVLP